MENSILLSLVFTSRAASSSMIWLGAISLILMVVSNRLSYDKGNDTVVTLTAALSASLIAAAAVVAFVEVSVTTTIASAAFSIIAGFAVFAFVTATVATISKKEQYLMFSIIYYIPMICYFLMLFV